MTNTCIKGVTYELYPNKTMKKVLDRNCDYRRYCWNQALALWHDLYDAYTILHTNNLNPKPNLSEFLAWDIAAHIVERPFTVDTVPE